MPRMRVQAASATTLAPGSTLGRPQIMLFCELPGPDLRALIARDPIRHELVRGGFGVALATRDLNETDAAAVRVLNQLGVPLVAWLQLQPGEGYWFNLQNYPQAVERYRAFHEWARHNQLRYIAVGLDIEPPVDHEAHNGWGVRNLLRRIWLARENVLYPAARAAFQDLIAEIHHDGYEVHTYQLPILADDRRAGTTLAQRALDIVDLPADVEVLMCYSSVPLDSVQNDLGGALIASYGSSADAIGVGAVTSTGQVESSSDDLPPLSWEAIERDLLLAARHTDMIYLASLEGCAERGLLPRIAAIDWDADVQAVGWKRALVAVLRSALLVALLLARFSRALFAWLGWGLAFLLLLRQVRSLRQGYRREGAGRIGNAE